MTEDGAAFVCAAAALACESVKTFLLVAANRQASEMLGSGRHITMSARGYQQFHSDLCATGESVAELRALMALQPFPQAFAG